MKRYYFIGLSTEQAKRLEKGMKSRFKWSIGFKYNASNETLELTMTTMGRTLYPDESSEAYPHRLGKGVTIDEIRWEHIGCYVNGFYNAIRL